jgi:hypothetical protein
LRQGFFLWQAFSAAASFWARSCAAVFAFGQPLTLIGVDWWITAPFWATNSVGIFNPPLTVHKFAFAVNALNLPWGNVSSKELTGASGTWANVDEVIPDLLMNVSPTRSIVIS